MVDAEVLKFPSGVYLRRFTKAATPVTATTTIAATTITAGFMVYPPFVFL